MAIHIPSRGLFALDRPRLMGILNATPDSFSDAGQFASADAAIEHARKMLKQGADIIDIGGESTRPGAKRISAREQIIRVAHVIRCVRALIDKAGSTALISIDTTRASVAKAALDAGASIINDVSAGRDDAKLFGLAAARRVPVVLMHMQGTPASMQDDPQYDNVVTEVRDFLLARAKAAEQAGIDARQIILDPGIGFGKKTEHNLELLRHLDSLVDTGFPILLGASRKSFLSKLGDQPVPANNRLGGTCATTALGVAAGVQLFRVHDVAANRQAADVAFALRAG